MPSSVKRTFEAGVFSVSISLGLQLVSALLLFFHKGSRLAHQVLCTVVIVGLITSASTILSGPTRLQSLCFNVPSGVSVKATMTPGGQLLFKLYPNSCFKWWRPCLWFIQAGFLSRPFWGKLCVSWQTIGCLQLLFSLQVYP
jgi:hypothetical protein